MASHLKGDTFTQNKSRREDVLYGIAEANVASEQANVPVGQRRAIRRICRLPRRRGHQEPRLRADHHRRAAARWQRMGGYGYVTPRKNDGSPLSPHPPSRAPRLATGYHLPGEWNRLARQDEPTTPHC